MRTKAQLRILVVDDLSDVTTSIKEALIRDGFSPANVVECSSPEEAARLLKRSISHPEERFDVVTIDLYMHGDWWAGTDLCEFIKRKFHVSGDQHDKTQSIIYSTYVYSRYGNKESGYQIDKLKHSKLMEMLEQYTRDGVIKAVLDKAIDDCHCELLKEINKLVKEPSS